MNNLKTTTKTEDLSKQYVHLLDLADKTTNRKDAIHLIHQADKVRQQLCQLQPSHPVCYG